MKILDEFKQWVDLHHLLRPSGKTLLAVSGGMDSMVLAQLFLDAGWDFGVAHCNFCLRGEASDGDEKFVEKWAESQSVPFFSKSFNTKKWAQTQKVSIQEAARSLRYDWLNSLATEEGFDQIATGHHLNDAIETTWMHLIRGTGLKGLTGIPIQQGRVVRPLLFASREDLTAYARDRALTWREDASNQEDYYTRNFIRHHLIPPAKEVNPQLESSARKTLEILRGTYSNYQFMIQHLLEQEVSVQNGAKVYPASLFSQFPDPASVLYDAFHSLGFSADQLLQAAQRLSMDEGLELLSETGVRMVIARNAIRIDSGKQEAIEIRIEADDLMVRLDEAGSRLIIQQGWEGNEYPDGRSELVVDLDKLIFPLIVRTWKSGDAFHPFGMQGKRQKVQDFFTNLKLSRQEKEQTLILENGDGAIIWILNYRMDERFKVEPWTKRKAKISLI
ncbi:MAG: tRNA lysidine(34) synthetase TilS [Saprospiraceae bacterium]